MRFQPAIRTLDPFCWSVSPLFHPSISTSDVDLFSTGENWRDWPHLFFQCTNMLFQVFWDQYQQSPLILKGIHYRQLHNSSRSSNNNNKSPDGTSMTNTLFTQHIL
jgi:hypothetical protein